MTGVQTCALPIYLDLYCYQVAGAVGAIMCFILKIDPDQREQALPYAIQMGQAMQMTNIARDILEDAQNNRAYLPDRKSVV